VISISIKKEEDSSEYMAKGELYLMSKKKPKVILIKCKESDIKETKEKLFIALKEIEDKYQKKSK
jgi:predicted nuclease of predicted toxin-antitoxin system